MVDADARNWKVNGIVARNTPSRADSPAAHRAFAGPRRPARIARPISSANRLSRPPSSAFTIRHSAFANFAGCKVGVKPLLADRKRPPNFPRKKQNEFCETNPKNRVADPKNADSPPKTNPNEPKRTQTNPLVSIPRPLESFPRFILQPLSFSLIVVPCSPPYQGGVGGGSRRCHRPPAIPPWQGGKQTARPYWKRHQSVGGPVGDGGFREARRAMASSSILRKRAASP